MFSKIKYLDPGFCRGDDCRATGCRI